MLSAAKRELGLIPTSTQMGHALGILLGQYLSWFAREGFPKSEIGRLLALMQKIDHNGLSDLLKPLRGGSKT